jgi:hypothetical protein
MADTQFTSGQRAEVYRRIFLLNRAFHFIVQRLEELTKIGIFNRRDIRETVGLTQEIQLEVNTALLDPLQKAENHDFAQFGKVRIAMEKRLLGPEPKPRKKTT